MPKRDDLLSERITTFSDDGLPSGIWTFLSSNVLQSDLIIFVYDSKGAALGHEIDVLGESIASDKPVVILVESKYKDDFERSGIANQYEKYAVENMSVPEYSSQNHEGAVQSLVQIIRSKSKKS